VAQLSSVAVTGPLRFSGPGELPSAPSLWGQRPGARECLARHALYTGKPRRGPVCAHVLAQAGVIHAFI
jgi:hypothetical protein